jgi:hypothetical protein
LQIFKFSFDPVEDAVDNFRLNALNVKRLGFNPFEFENVPSVVIAVPYVLSKTFDQILFSFF